MNNLLSKLSKGKHKALKVSFFNLYGFHLINDNNGEHYIYLHNDDRMEEKLKFFSIFKNCFTFTRKISSSNILNAYIKFKYNEYTFDIIDRFALKFIWSTLDDAIVTNYSFTTRKKTNENYYKQYIRNDKDGYIPL